VSADDEGTGRGWTARQPDGTPVGDLPLRPGTINALRAGGILTLGDLRAMRDRDLMALRRFGRGTLADVRLLVPVPAESPVASAGGGVTIAGRAFTVGTTYAARPGLGPGNRRPRRLLRHSADSPLSGGRVEVAIVPSGKKRVMAGTEWAAWAGEPVGDGPGDAGGG
jgi:hypothetical protein